MANPARQICFVDMPFGKKTNHTTGLEIDFDQIYECGIEPAIKQAGLEPIRGDREETGGIIHTAMFARLLLAEFVIADMTNANPNVFYELGVRHTAKPYTTIPIFATLDAPPFDVNMVRAIPYDLTDGHLDDQAAGQLVQALSERIDRALRGPVTKDSPLFDLFPQFPGIEMSHELTDIFRDRVDYAETVKNQLASMRLIKPREQAVQAIGGYARSLGAINTLESGVLIDIYLSYRALDAFDAMIALYDDMPGAVRDAALSRQQLGFALNRRNQPGDRDRAVNILERLLREQGESAETLGILARIYKDQYTEATKRKDFAAPGFLDRAIETYTRGFEVEPVDFYPGVNAINLLLQKGDDEARNEVERLTPLVTFAAVRKGGATSSDYWTVATVLELACAGRDYGLAQRCIGRALSLAKEPWMFETTARNLRLIHRLRENEEGIDMVATLASTLEQAAEKQR